MAYSAVPTVATGDLWTAANHNTYIRDNFSAGVPHIFTAKGDMVAAGGSQDAKKVAVGSVGQVLTPDSGETAGIKWADNLNPKITALTNSSWDGDAKAEATHTITLNSFNAAIPNTAKVVFVTGWVDFIGVGSGYYLQIKPYGGTPAVYCRSVPDTAYPVGFSGMVPVGDSGRIQVDCIGSGMTVYLAIVGWF